MSSPVSSLQTAILEGQQSLTQLLRQTKIIAAKAGLKDLETWVDLELKGYPDGTEPPSYRKFSVSNLQVCNPALGWQPAGQAHRTVKARQPVPELENCKSDAMLTMSVAKNLPVRDITGSSLPAKWPQRFVFSVSEFRNIIEAIKDELLRRVVELENDRVLGRDMATQKQKPALIIPDFAWYSAISDKSGGTKRCPFARADRCPRYYESLSLLGEVGITTKIRAEEEAKLREKWKGFEATLGEEAASISGGKENSSKAMSNFCPEVNFKIFGLFASGLYPHVGEIDRDSAHAKLGEEGAHADAPRWQWASVKPCHYTECPEYSILQMKPNESQTPTTPNQTFHIHGAVHGAVGNVNNSQITVYDYSSIQQLLIDRKIPKNDRRELEDIMDELKDAPSAKKPSLLARAEQWIVKHKELLGTAADAVGKAIGSAMGTRSE